MHFKEAVCWEWCSALCVSQATMRSVHAHASAGICNTLPREMMDLCEELTKSVVTFNASCSVPWCQLVTMVSNSTNEVSVSGSAPISCTSIESWTVLLSNWCIRWCSPILRLLGLGSKEFAEGTCRWYRENNLALSVAPSIPGAKKKAQMHFKEAVCWEWCSALCAIHAAPTEWCTYLRS